MGTLLTQLIPTALVGAISPLPVIITVTLLMTNHGLKKAVAFTVGSTFLYALIGVLAVIFSADSNGATPTRKIVTGTIIAVLGGLLILIP